VIDQPAFDPASLNVCLPTDQLPVITAAQPMAGQISIHGSDGHPLVTIHIDEQHIEYGPGYEPDDAARAFWDAMQRHMPSPMVRQFGQPLTDSINAELKAGQEAQQTVERVRSLANDMLQAQHGVDLEADGIRRAIGARIHAVLNRKNRETP
jgi:hypothetical protein